MSFVTCSYGRQHYEFQPCPGLPVLILSNSLGTDLSMWDSQVEAMQEHVSLLRYDTRGQGRSDTPSGPYTIPQMGQDVLDMMDHLGIRSAHVCGLSMGGMVAQWLGIHASARLLSLTLSNTAAKIGSIESWDARIRNVQTDGLAAIVPSVLERWYSPAFRSPGRSSVETTRQLLLNNDTDGYLATCAAVRDADFRSAVSRIHTPTLVIAGALDPVTTLDDAHFLTANIPGSALTVLEAAHLSNIEASAAFNSALIHFCKTNEEIRTHE